MPDYSSTLLAALEALPPTYGWRAPLINLARLFDLAFANVSQHKAEEQDSFISNTPPELPLLRDTADLTDLAHPLQYVLLLALVPHLRPGFIDQLVQDYLPAGGELPEFGGSRGTAHRGLLPTGETALFLLASTNTQAYQEYAVALFGPQSPLIAKGLVSLTEVPLGEPRLSGRLVLDAQLLSVLLHGQSLGPVFGADFPAQRLHTKLTWDALVLPAITSDSLADVKRWVTFRQQLHEQWGLSARLKPGYRALFYGPPGTGKTFAATLLGQDTGHDVYRVDLSLITSKYIGETEKNLSRLFDRAEGQDWILFFDEADALFGKRTETQNAHDRFANQEVAYLLQRIEEYDGLVILASNLKSNLDPAFARRFQAMIPFPMPTPAERLLLWQYMLKGIESKLPIAQLAARYELSGAGILNAIQFAALRASSRKEDVLSQAELVEGIRLEYQKDGRLL